MKSYLKNKIKMHRPPHKSRTKEEEEMAEIPPRGQHRPIAEFDAKCRTNQLLVAFRESCEELCLEDGLKKTCILIGDVHNK